MKQVIIPLQEYEETNRQVDNLKRSIRELLIGAQEIAKFLDFLAKEMDFKKEVEEFNSRSTRSTIVERDGNYRIILNYETEGNQSED